MKKQIAFLFLLCLCGCELVVNVDNPFKHSQLTVNLFFTPDSLWSAQITYNKSVLDETPFQGVNNAVAVVYQNDVPIDTLTNIGNGKYRGNNKPLPNVAYEIKVSALGYESVSSQAKPIPPPAQITAIDFVEDNNTQEIEPLTTVTIKFQDDPAELNYYEIRVEGEIDFYDYQNDSIRTHRYPMEIESKEGTTNGDENMQENILRDDILFNGKKAEISFKTPLNYYYSKKYSIMLRTVTEDYYKYETTEQLQTSVAGDPFAQPVNVFNNISNGFGIFAGYSQSSFIQISPQPTIDSVSPMYGKSGDHFLITGTEFSQSEVTFSADGHPIYCQVVRQTENEIEAVVPPQAVTGKIVVRNRGYLWASEDDFLVE